MSFNTSVYRLGDLAEVNWGDTSTTKSAYTATGFRAFSASGPDGFLPYSDHDRTGIVIGAIGANCGETWLAEGKWSSIKNTITAWSTSPELDTRYLYWLTKRKGFFPTRGSAQPFISQGDARTIEIEIPPIEHQKAIAYILGTLVNKIELNRKTNETLEGIAKALFKSWFVDFDPVRAKAEGRPTGLPDEISELFPDSLEESELGEIPSGWKFEPLGALTSWSSGSTPSKKNPDYWGGFVPWISANSMKDIFAINSDLKLTVQGVASGAKLARAGSILLLVRGSGLHSRISMCLAASEVSFNQDVKAIEASNEFGISALQVFAYLSAISDQLLEMVEFTGIGAGKLDTDTLLALPFAVPGECLTRAIEEVLAPIYEKIKVNLWMENSLEHLRDTLLPRLISGELRVPDAEKMLEEIGV